MSIVTYWKPRLQGKLMVVPFLADGITPSKIAVLHDARKFKSLAIVIETNNTNVASHGDVILYKEGFAEEFCDSVGEMFFLVDERDVVTILDNLTLEEDKHITGYGETSFSLIIGA